MSRNCKITSQNVLEKLYEYVYITAAELADALGVCVATIRRHIKILRNDGEHIIHSKNGYTLVDKELLQEPEIAIDLNRYMDWALSVVKGMIICTKPIRPLLPVMRKVLRDGLTKEEKKELLKSCTRMVTLLAYVEAEEDMDED